jgi:hypothetical protein
MMRRTIVALVLIGGWLAGGLFAASARARADCMMGCMPMPDPMMSGTTMGMMPPGTMPGTTSGAVAVSALPAGLSQAGVVTAGPHTVSVLAAPGLAVTATASGDAINLKGPAGAAVYLTNLAHTFVVTLDANGTASVPDALFSS